MDRVFSIFSFSSHYVVNYKEGILHFLNSTASINILILILNCWLYRVLLRQGARKHAPWFYAYVVCGILDSCVELVSSTTTFQLRIPVGWSVIVSAILLIGAFWDSLRRDFKQVTPPKSFHILLWTPIAAVLAYCVWKAAHTPFIQAKHPPFTHPKWFFVYVIGGSFGVDWAVAFVAGAILTYLLKNGKKEKFTDAAPAIILGLGFASLAGLIQLTGGLFFGAKIGSITDFVPTLGYCLTIACWIVFFSSPRFGLRSVVPPVEIQPA